jgi:release factor glutamine methyltransferase
MASLHERLLHARHALIRAGIDGEDAALDAELLARHLLGWDRATLLARGRNPAPPEFDARYDRLLARRAAREPAAYIIGRREFWGLDFEITPDVLIPRPETEAVIEEAVDAAATYGPFRTIADVGTGSGCIAIALAVEFPAARIVATDTSPGALAVAQRNAARHGVAPRITFVRCDLLEGTAIPAELIASNPPYVAESDATSLPPEVGRYEPADALFGGRDGLAVLRRLFATAAQHLATGGSLVVEFGFGQEATVRALAQDAGWHVVRVRNDLQAIPRVAVLERLRPRRASGRGPQRGPPRWGGS